MLSAVFMLYLVYVLATSMVISGRGVVSCFMCFVLFMFYMVWCVVCCVLCFVQCKV